MIFTIDGNIGSGKSTLLDYLHNTFNLSTDPEPVTKWQPFLEDIYKNKKGTFEFQVRVWLDRCWVQQRPEMAPIIMERSPYFQRNVFVPVNYENGQLTSREFQIVHELYAKSSSLWCPFGYIYLRSNPTNCSTRIKKRARPSEEEILEEYLKKLHDLHESSYIWAATHGVPIVCIDVEGKTTPEIAKEVYHALVHMGLPYQ